MKRALVAMVLVVGLGAGSALSATSTGTVQALVWERNTLSLATLDATTLAPRGRLLALGRAHGSVHADRLGDRLAVASEGAGIAIVDTRRMRLVWRLPPRGRHVRAVSWLSPNRLLVVEHGSVLVVDPVRKRIAAQAVYEGTVLGHAEWHNGLVLLVGGSHAIEPARLAIVGPSVRIRTVELGRIPTGTAPSPTEEHWFNHAHPGLAVDRASGRAYVAGGMQIATVDLGSLTLAYGGTERTLQKLITGPRRTVAWLGDGTLAVAGADDRWTEAGATSTPFGLRYVRPTGVSIVDERATAVRVVGDHALAYGIRHTAGRAAGMGIAAYDRSGTVRWRLFGDAPIDGVQVANGRAYVWAQGAWYLVNITSGTVLNTAKPRWRWFQILG